MFPNFFRQLLYWLRNLNVNKYATFWIIFKWWSILSPILTESSFSAVIGKEKKYLAN